MEDYTQYKVRGHYTRNAILANYFKAMMYAGRMNFQLNSNPEVPLYDGKTPELHTRMSLLLISSFNESRDGETVWSYWDRVYEPTVFYVGSADDLTPLEYYSLWKSIGSPIGDDLTDVKITEFRSQANSFRKPQINSMFVYDAGSGTIAENSTQGMRLIGQRFIPDSYMFQQLVHGNVEDRFMVSGLDVMSVLGSAQAEKYMQPDNITYGGYGSKIQSLRTEFLNVTDYDWVQNLYWQWLYTLLPLLGRETTGFPGFMQTYEWFDKELITALGSWAELRHDTILYAKQSYTTVTETVRNLPPLKSGYVEPNPELYSRLQSLVGYMKNGLQNRGIMPDSFSNKFTVFENILNNLVELSIKELTNQELSVADISYIDNVGATIGNLASFQDPEFSEWVSDTDDKIAIIADVHTDPNSGSYLEVGVGNPLIIYVIVQDEHGQLRLTKGLTFSYYEFVSSERLSDEDWQSMLSTTTPEMPEWITLNLPIELFSLGGNLLSYIMIIHIRRNE